MTHQSRRSFIASAAFVAAASPSLFKAPYGTAATRASRVFIASSGPDGILAYDWDDAKGQLTPAGVAAALPNVEWLTSAHRREYIYAASDIRSFNGKSTGEVASFRLRKTEA